MGWQRRAFCNCGYSVRPAFGDKFHIHEPVCPDCGSATSSFAMKTVRWVKDKYEGRWWNSRLVEGAHWEELP